MSTAREGTVMDDALTGATGSSAEPTAAGTAPADRRLDLAPEADVDLDAAIADDGDGDGEATSTRKRRRGSRGGQRRKKPTATSGDESTEGDTVADEAPGLVAAPPADGHPELPESMREGRAEPEAAERALVRKPQIGDTRPAPATDTARVAPA